MLTFFLDKQSEISLYEQLYQGIKKEIEEGVLKKNEKLPSKRKLANHLKISQTTIESAYQQLLAEGYIISKPKVGYFVAIDLELLHKITVPQKIKIKSKKLEDYLVDFKTNQIDQETFPYEKLARIERDIVLDKFKYNINRGDIFGVYEFRQRIAEVLFAYRGIKASPEQIIVGSGSEHLLSILVLLLGREKLYAVENPSYVKNYLLYKAYGASVKGIMLDEKGVDIKELRKEKCSYIH
ncbi:MAG: aminotransferase class I/II-fold pyridoxal phosphate-dependent enzyme, partial [Candidatus Izemoplasmatales bacterium]